MPPLSRDKMLALGLSGIMCRNQFTQHPDGVIVELVEAAGDRTEILAREAGTWIGFYDSGDTHVLAEALRQIPGADEWIEEGRARRNAPVHGTAGFDRSR